jgi:hypothetical protein
MMLEAGLPNSRPTGDGGAGQQDVSLGLDGLNPPWSHTWYEKPPRKRSRRRVQSNGQNGRAGPSTPRGGSPIDGGDSLDDKVHVPYRQVSVAFVSRVAVQDRSYNALLNGCLPCIRVQSYDENTYRQDKYGNPILTPPARTAASSSTSKAKRAGSKQPERPSSKNNKRSDSASLSLRRAATTSRGQDEEDDFRIVEDGEDKWATSNWHVDEAVHSRRSTPSAYTGDASSRRTSTPSSAQPTPPPDDDEQAPAGDPAIPARLHCVGFFPFGQPDIDEIRREEEELVRQFFYRRPDYGRILESGETLRPTRLEEELEHEIGLKLGIGPYPDKGPRTDVVLGENGWYRYIGEPGEEAKGSPINLAVKAFEKMVRGWEGCFAVCGGQRVSWMNRGCSSGSVSTAS